MDFENAVVVNRGDWFTIETESRRWSSIGWVPKVEPFEHELSPHMPRLEMFDQSKKEEQLKLALTAMDDRKSLGEKVLTDPNYIPGGGKLNEKPPQTEPPKPSEPDEA